MKKKSYLLDTHALIFWAGKTNVTPEFVSFFDKQAQQGTLYVSSITFWEIAFLVQKNRVAISDIHAWKDELLSNTTLHLIDPSASEMIDSTLLPPHHKDPFDRLLISQAKSRNLILVTKDRMIPTYDVNCTWM